MQQRFLLQILLLAQHVSGITMPIIRSSRVLYRSYCMLDMFRAPLCPSSGAQEYNTDLIACSTCFGHHYAHHQELKSIIQILLLARHVSGTTMPIIRSSRALYRSYCLLKMFRAPLCPSSGAQEYYTVVAACGIPCCDFSSSWSGVELRVTCPVCRMLQHPANRTHNPQLHTRPAT